MAAAPLDPALVLRAFADLGVHPTDIAALEGAPYEEARQKLAELKAIARKNFRRLAFELHPDRTGDDPEKTAFLRVLVAVRDDLEHVEVRVLPPQPSPVPMHPIATNPFDYLRKHPHVPRRR